MWLVQMLGDVAFIVATVGAGTFVFVYALGSAWRTTRVGRAIMRFFTTITIIFALVVLFSYWDTVDEAFVDWLALILFTGLAVEMWRLVYVLVRTQRRDRRNEPE